MKLPAVTQQEQPAQLHPVVAKVRKEREKAEMKKTTIERQENSNGSKFEYWIPKPDLKSWRARGLAFVNIMTASGLCSLAILGFVFNQVDQGQFGELFTKIRWWLMLGGSICLAIGSEIGTLVTTVEIFRKQSMSKRRPVLARVLISVLAIARAVQVVKEALSQMAKSSTDKTFSQAIKMIDRTLKSQEKGAALGDWAGLAISILTSLSAVTLAYVSGMSLSNTIYTWLPMLQQWSPPALFIFGALDGYVNHAEYGLFLASFDEQVRQWFADREAARKEVEKHNRKNTQ